MAINKNSKESFLQALDEADNILITMQFIQCSFIKKGYSYFVKYRKGDCIVEFLYGPPEYAVEMIIYVSENKFAFKDLLKNNTILKWVEKNKYLIGVEDTLRNDLLWFVELLRFSLLIINI